MTWTPRQLTTSPGASAVFEFDANDADDVALSSDDTVHRVKNSLDPGQTLVAQVATGGNGILIDNNSGADGERRVLEFHPTQINASNYDPSTNWLSAGGVDGSAGRTLVDLANSDNLSTSGSFTTIIALDIDKNYTYAAGPLWGSLVLLQYAQIRYNGISNVAGGEVFDSHITGAVAQGSVAAGWHVMTMIKAGDTVTYRLDGHEVATAKITSTLPFTADDFMIGGGLPPASSESAGAENGVPPHYVGEFQAYSGVLAGTDLTNAEDLAAGSIGLPIGGSRPPPAASTDNAAAPAAPGSTFSVTDTVTGRTTQQAGQAYTGPVTYLTSEYVAVTQDSLNITSSVPNAFIVTGAGNDAVDTSKAGGSNVISAGGGSNFITGGGGNNTLFLDVRSSVDVWDTNTDFHAGDAITLYGMTPSQMYSWWDNLGAAGYTGLTIMMQVAGQPNATLTMTGYTTADLNNGKLSLAFGGQGTANPYLLLQGH
jgi:WD40 repeat protein